MKPSIKKYSAFSIFMLSSIKPNIFNAECLFTVMVNVVMLSVVKLSVVVPIVASPTVTSPKKNGLYGFDLQDAEDGGQLDHVWSLSGSLTTETWPRRRPTFYRLEARKKNTAETDGESEETTDH